jgi:hypothetical protein
MLLNMPLPKPELSFFQYRGQHSERIDTLPWGSEREKFRFSQKLTKAAHVVVGSGEEQEEIQSGDV